MNYLKALGKILKIKLQVTFWIRTVEERNGFYALLPDEVNRCNAKKRRGFAKAKYTIVRI